MFGDQLLPAQNLTGGLLWKSLRARRPEVWNVDLEDILGLLLVFGLRGAGTVRHEKAGPV